MIDFRSLIAVVREAITETWIAADFLIRKADDRWILGADVDTLRETPLAAADLAT